MGAVCATRNKSRMEFMDYLRLLKNIAHINSLIPCKVIINPKVANMNINEPLFYSILLCNRGTTLVSNKFRSRFKKLAFVLLLLFTPDFANTKNNAICIVTIMCVCIYIISLYSRDCYITSMYIK